MYFLEDFVSQVLNLSEYWAQFANTQTGRRTLQCVPTEADLSQENRCFLLCFEYRSRIAGLPSIGRWSFPSDPQCKRGRVGQLVSLVLIHITKKDSKAHSFVGNYKVYGVPV